MKAQRKGIRPPQYTLDEILDMREQAPRDENVPDFLALHEMRLISGIRELNERYGRAVPLDLRQTPDTLIVRDPDAVLAQLEALLVGSGPTTQA